MVQGADVGWDERRRALSDPLRVRIRELLAGNEMTANELARALGVIANRLYYHLRILESAELIAVVGRRAEGRMAEKVYALARSSLGNELAGDDPVGQAVFFAAVLDATKAELTEIVLDVDSHRERRARYFVRRGLLLATDGEVDDFWRTVERMIDEQNERSAARRALDPPAAATSERRHTITVALYEQPQRDSDASA